MTMNSVNLFLSTSTFSNELKFVFFLLKQYFDMHMSITTGCQNGL